MASEPYTERELMVSAAAREIDDGDNVFVGMRLPLIAFQVAVSTHAPNALSVFESGVIREDPADGFLHTMCDLPNLNSALSTTSMIDIMSRLQRGEIDVGFLGGAEIDRYGNLNTTRVQAGDREAQRASSREDQSSSGSRLPADNSRAKPGDREIRLPGSGGACDIACMSERTVILMAHEPRRFAERVHYNTSPGHGTGGAWREEQGVPGGGPAALVTTKATFGFDESGELFLRSVHPGVSVETVERDIPWELKTAADVDEEGEITTTDEPTDEEVDLIRTFDPEGFWTR